MEQSANMNSDMNNYNNNNNGYNENIVEKKCWSIITTQRRPLIAITTTATIRSIVAYRLFVCQFM